MPFVTTLENRSPIAAAFLNENFGFVKTDSAIFRTTNGGITWTKLKGMPWMTYTDQSDQFYFYKPDDIFLAGTYESIDSGTSWRMLPNPTGSHCLYIKDGVFFDASGNVSYDHTNTWQVASGYQNYFIGGNLDNGMSLWGGENGATRYTTDGGKTWPGGHVGPSGEDTYSIPFTLINIRGGGDADVTVIKRSIDGGNSWLPSYSSSTLLSGSVKGDGCIIYSQTSLYHPSISGFIQSVDQGNTWTQIGGPSGLDDFPICGVCSRGAACFGITYYAQYQGITPKPLGAIDTLWKYFDSSLFRSILADTKIERSFSDTVFATECDLVRLQLNLSFNSCDFIQYQNLQLDQLPSRGESLLTKSFKINFTEGKIIRNEHPDTSSVLIFPQNPGTYHLQIHLHLAAQDWTGYDTILPIVLVVKRNLPLLVVNKNDTVHFTTKPICLSGGKDTIALSNPSCEKIAITNIRIETDSVANNDFSISSFVPFDLALKNSPYKIIADFHPKSTGIKNANIIIESNIGNDTIPIKSYVSPDTVKLFISKKQYVDFGSKSICEAGGRDTVFLSNPGCSAIRINDILFDADSTITKDFSLISSSNYLLQWNSQPGKIIIDFHPKTPGIKSARIIIKTSVNIDTIPVSATVLPDTCIQSLVSGIIRNGFQQFSIHPNPAQDEIEVALQSPLNQNATIEIHNALGAQIFSGSKNLIFGSNSIHIDTKSLSEGMYFLRVTSLCGVASQNFVKVK